MTIKLEERKIMQAAQEGTDAFLSVFVEALSEAIGGELTADNISQLSPKQTTLWAFHVLHDEVMDGGFVQLIVNGYGPFIFFNPFAKAMRSWGLNNLARLINKAGRYYRKRHEELERDFSDEEFMALYEQFPEFDDIDDEFVVEEENFVAAVAHYVDEHIGQFVEVVR